jgi:hypothetical protein
MIEIRCMCKSEWNNNYNICKDIVIVQFRFARKSNNNNAVLKRTKTAEHCRIIKLTIDQRTRRTGP